MSDVIHCFQIELKTNEFAGQLRNSQYGRPSSMPLPSSNGMSKDIRVIVQSSGRKSRPSSYSTFVEDFAN